MIILVALASVALIGMLGLALDLGYNFEQRRMEQNAADAAVTVGLNDVIQSMNASPAGSINNTCADVTSSLAKNGFPVTDCETPSTKVLCEFVDNSDNQTGLCNAPNLQAAPLKNTSGVRVTLTATHNTFLMSVLGIATSTVSAPATGHVETVTSQDASGLLFVVCGAQTAEDLSGIPAFDLYATQTSPAPTNGVQAPYESWPPKINPAVLANPTAYPFLIDAPNGGSSGKGINDCGVGSSFKGPIANGSGIISFSYGVAGGGVWVLGQKGMKAGPTKQRLQNACGSTIVDGCLMVVPIAEDPLHTPQPTGNNQIQCTSGGNDLCVDMWVVMQIYNSSFGKGKSYRGVVVVPQPPVNDDGSLTVTVGGGSNGQLINPRLTK
jgi:hypothetical protein